MRTSFASLAVAFCAFRACFVAAVTTPLLSVERYQGKVSGRYIIQFKEGASYESSSLYQEVSSRAKGGITKLDIINGISGVFNEDTINKFRSSPDVALISEDGIMTSMATQTGAPWNLARISSKTRLTGSATVLNFTYNYDGSGGKGVDIYVVDTGKATKYILGIIVLTLQHLFGNKLSRHLEPEFGGRASWGATFGGYANVDGNGHGTHIAAIAAGSTYGVAKLANIIAVKALSDAGSGAVSDIISGINWSANNAQKTGRPGVIILSLGGSASVAMDNAVKAVIAGGIHVCVASGNSNQDASTSSPARVPEALTIAASTFADARLGTGNYGSLIDFYAPGENILSAWIGGSAPRRLTGSSVATPHVAGLVAYLIALKGNQTPAAMASTLDQLSLKGVLTGVPANTRNNLISNGYY
ncbi:hypothetical protein CVT24_008310 [Panaeolus cyanescens]|uniref:Peptidase S8/S53 domain-containing protein n=1 Tax=Panaeolus cyanescens TaxID=181874 RepID=A0A409YLQ4_9AGAR|nr:hypothetical protein CVT24_008310 [Panaeolus cyanescens]